MGTPITAELPRTHIQTRYRGRQKVCCDIYLKVVYTTEADAKQAATTISVRTPMGHYLGKECGYWHVYTKRRRRY